MKVFFLGETYRPDAQTWLNGLQMSADCEIRSWELPAHTGPFARIARFFDWVLALFTLRKKILEFGPDIILAYRVPSYGFLGAWAGLHPFVVAQQGVTDIYPPNHWTTPFKIWLKKFALRRADLIQAWGEVMVPSMLIIEGAKSKIHIMPKGIDLERFRFTETDKEPDLFTAVVTRSLSAPYRHDVILRATKRIKDAGIPFRLIIAGDGPLMPSLQKLAEELGIDDVTEWVGRIPNTGLPVLLRKSNLYISTPVSEGVSSSLFEAMASGCFPIVTDLPANRYWIENGKNGFLIPEGNDAELADRIISLWGNRAMIKPAIENNRKVVEEKADLRKNMPVFIELYRGLIAKHKKR